MKRSFMTRIAAGFAAIAMIAAAGGCGKAEEKKTETSSSTTKAVENTDTSASADAKDKNDASSAGTDAPADTASDQSLQKVLDSKQFVLGLDASFPPMGFTDEANEIIGFDIDVAQAVCDKMGVTLVKQPIVWDNKEEDLNVGKIDCVWNGMSINDSRKKAMNLSEPYMNNEMIFVVPGDSTVTTMDGLEGKTIGVQAGSTAEEILNNWDKAGSVTIVTGEDNVNLLENMKLGFSDAVFLDSIVANYFITEKKMNYIVLPGNLEAEEYAIGFRKNDQALRDEVQKILHELKADGTLAAISTKWFGKDVTTVK